MWLGSRWVEVKRAWLSVCYKKTIVKAVNHCSPCVILGIWNLQSALWNVYLSSVMYKHLWICTLLQMLSAIDRHTPVHNLRSDKWKLKQVVPARNLWYGFPCICHGNTGRFSQIHQLLMAHITPWGIQVKGNLPP